MASQLWCLDSSFPKGEGAGAEQNHQVVWQRTGLKEDSPLCDQCGSRMKLEQKKMKELLTVAEDAPVMPTAAQLKHNMDNNRVPQRDLA